MAITQRGGVLGQVQQQGQSSVQTVINLARQLQANRAPVYSAPAPVYSAPLSQRWDIAPGTGATGAYRTSPGTASAAQQILAAAQSRQQARPAVLNDVARNAVLTALAVATGAPQRQPQPMNRLAMEPQSTRLSPGQESQLFDQQMQITKAEANQYVPGMGFFEDPLQDARRAQYTRMESGFRNPAANTRLQLETEIAQRMPGMDPRQLRGLSDETLLDLRYYPTQTVNADQYRRPDPRYDPLSSALPGTPPGASSAAGASDPVMGSTPSFEMTRGYDPLSGPKTGTPAPYYDPLSGNKTGTALVTEAMQGAMTQGNTQSDDGGGFFDTLGEAAGGAWGAATSTIGELASDLKDAAEGPYEAFLQTPAGEVMVTVLEALDWPRTEFAGRAGQNAYEVATNTGSHDGVLDTVIDISESAETVFFAAMFAVDPEFKDGVIESYEQGYSSDDYLDKLEAAGIDPESAPPEFTEGRAVWEFMIGYATDDKPAAIKYPVRIMIDLAYDPLTYVPYVGTAGKLVKEWGRATRVIEGAGTGTKVVGGLAEGAGKTIEIAAKAPDAPVEGVIKVGGRVIRKTGEVTGLFSPSTSGAREAAGATAAQLDEALTAGRASIPNAGVRVAFDAEAQGVAPTSGPRLISDVTPPASTVTPPASGAAPSGGSAAPEPSAGGATPTVTTPGGSTVPSFESLADVPTARPNAPAKVYDYNGQDLIIRSGTSRDGSTFFSAQTRGNTSVRNVATADSYEALMDELPTVLGGSHPSITTAAPEPVGAAAGRTATGPTLADVNTEIHNRRMGAYPSLTPRESAAEMLRLKTLRNDMRAGRVPSDGVDTTPAGRPAVTKVERDAAAAAGSAPDVPRSTGASEIVRAGEAAKTAPKKPTMSAANRKAYPELGKAKKRQERMAKEDATGATREVNKILAPQKKGEHEFSPVYGGHRPLDKIVTKAIDSKDPAQMKRANDFVKQVDESVETNLRPDPFYRTFKNGGAEVYVQRDPRMPMDLIEQMRALDPEADAFRRNVLANGLAKGVLDDIAELQYQLSHLFPMLIKEYPEEFTIDGLLGSVGRAPTKNFRDESAEWLTREYLDTPIPEVAETILTKFLTGITEVPIIADGVHVPYAHSVPMPYHAESIARLRQMREQWTKIKRDPAFAQEVPDTAFREADRAAQFAGGSKGTSKGIATSIKASAGKSKPSDEDVLLAMGEINDPEISRILLKGDGKLTADKARGLDQAMPEGWKPAGYTGDKTSWNMKDALDEAREHSFRDPAWDHRRAVDEIGQLAAGLQPKLTPQQLKSARAAAKANGLDPKLVVDGTSAMERATATKAVRGLDWYMRQYRAVRLFNPIVGLPNRIGDVLGNAAALAGPGGNPLGALRSIPLTFTEMRAYRSAARDQGKVLAEWAVNTSDMVESASTYPDGLISYSKLQDAGLAEGLPPVNKKVAGTPQAIRTAASLWTSPALKDMMVASEMAGRKIAFDKVRGNTIRNEGWKAFKRELDQRYPGQSGAIMESINTIANNKGGKSWGGMFSPGDVYAATGDTQLQRRWQRELNHASDKGVAEARRLFFDGGMTNADEIARRTLTFHYWMVRSTALYGRWVLRNPVLLSGFFKMYQEAQQIAEEQGLPGWLGAMMKFYTIPGNATGYAAMDPIGMLFPTFFMDAYSQEGNKFQALQNLLIPPWSAALGALGVTQHVPDPFGTRGIERFVVDMGNFLKGEGVPLESIPGFGKFIDEDSLTLKIPTEEFTKLLIGGANDLLEKAGVSFGDYTPFDRSANEKDQLFSIGIQVATELYGPDVENWTPEQVAELNAAVEQAMNGEGEDTWLSETIRSHYGREAGARAGFALAIPGGVVTRQGARDQQIEDSQKYWENFYAGKPTTKEGESAAAARSLATSAVPVWVALNNEYYKIGTEDEQQQYTLFNDMRYSPEELNPNATIIINNGNGVYTFYSMAQLAALSEEDRETVLSAWMEDNPDVQTAYEKVKTGRDQFEVDHPDYGQYTEYRSGVYGYDGGATQFRKDMADNPTFKAAEDAQRTRLKGEGKTGAVLEAELDDWATTQQAYFAATGQKYKNTDTIKGTPGPSSVGAMFSLRKDEDEGGGTTTEPKEEEKDPNVDDYWGPEKGVPRLATDQAQYDAENAKMEQRFGAAWNQGAGEWEDNADSSKERDQLGIGDIPYKLPTTSDLMRQYESWEYDHPGGTPEAFFDELLQTVGYGVKLPGTGTTSKLPGGTTYTSPYQSSGASPARQARGMINQIRGGPGGVTSEPVPPTSKEAAPQANGSVTMMGGKAYPLSQEYGMTDFARTQSYPGGMYGYTDQYTPSGEYVGHMGVDIGTPLGTELHAPVSGTVVQAGGVGWEQDDRYGEQPQTGGLRIELQNGDIVVMAHMQEITVSVGDTVQQGQVVGYSGTAGASPNDPGAGAHVHVEYRQYAPGQTGSGYLAIDPRTKLDLGV